jgi:hypothetical protein
MQYADAKFNIYLLHVNSVLHAVPNTLSDINIIFIPHQKHYGVERNRMRRRKACELRQEGDGKGM